MHVDTEHLRNDAWPGLFILNKINIYISDNPAESPHYRRFFVRNKNMAMYN